MPAHYLTLSRSLAYQGASVVSMATGGVASYALKTYTNDKLTASSYGATLSNAPIAGAGGIVVASGALAGTLTGLAYLAILLHPGHGETTKSYHIKVIAFSLVTLFSGIAALVSAIITATGKATLDSTGLSAATRATIISKLTSSSRAYSASKATVAFTVLSWIAFSLLVLSAVLCTLHARHVLRNGPAVGVEKQLPERVAGKYLRGRFGISAEGTEVGMDGKERV